MPPPPSPPSSGATSSTLRSEGGGKEEKGSVVAADPVNLQLRTTAWRSQLSSSIAAAENKPNRTKKGGALKLALGPRSELGVELYNHFKDGTDGVEEETREELRKAGREEGAALTFLERESVWFWNLYWGGVTGGRGRFGRGGGGHWIP